MVKIFNNQDEQGVETVNSAAGSATQAVKKTAKSVADQFDIVNYLYGTSNKQPEPQDPNQDSAVTEVMRPYQGKANASLKARVNLKNPIVAQAMVQRMQQLSKRKAPEKVDELERLRLLLHEEQVREIMNPQPSQSEEPITVQIAREEEEKKAKKKEKQVEEVKKKEDLAVVQKRTSIENKGFGAG
jgi:hypothetical protein